MTERRSKFPPLIVDGVDINESANSIADQVLVEVEAMKTGAKRLKALIEELFDCRDAGAQLPSDLLDQISTVMGEFITEMSKRDEGRPT